MAGAKVAGDAAREIAKQINRPIANKANFLPKPVEAAALSPPTPGQRRRRRRRPRRRGRRSRVMAAKKRKLTAAEQRKRFTELTRELGVDESEAAQKRAFGKVGLKKPKKAMSPKKK
jgi:hypothetical protein